MSSNATALAKKESGTVAHPEPTNSNLVTALDRLGETPEYIDCPFCHKRTKTRVTKTDSDATCMATALCCLATGILGVCLPSLCHWCANIDHHCTECGQHVMHRPHEGPPEVKGPGLNTRQAVSQYAPMPEQSRPQLDRRWSDIQGTIDGTVPQEESGDTHTELKNNEEHQV